MITLVGKKQILWRYVVFLLFFSLNGLLAQVNWTNLYVNYRHGQYEQIRTALTKVSDQQKQELEFLFFSSLFEKDGARAIQNYQLIFRRAYGWLKKAAAKKCYEYYFARGLYQQAESYARFLETISEACQSSMEEPQETIYWIQLGAFSSGSNARKRRDTLEKNGIKSIIKIRKINNRDYYCVWVKGRATLADTEQIARQIKNQLKFNYRIIKE